MRVRPMRGAAALTSATSPRRPRDSMRRRTPSSDRRGGWRRAGSGRPRPGAIRRTRSPSTCRGRPGCSSGSSRVRPRHRRQPTSRCPCGERLSPNRSRRVSGDGSPVVPAGARPRGTDRRACDTTRRCQAASLPTRQTGGRARPVSGSSTRERARRRKNRSRRSLSTNMRRGGPSGRQSTSGSSRSPS